MANLDDLIDAYLDGLDGAEWIAAHEAKQLKEMLVADDPDALRAWLDQHAARFLAEELARRSSRRRRLVHNTSLKPSAFANHLTSFNRQDQTAGSRFDPFKATCVVNDANVRKPIGKMTREDHLYVAYRHERRSTAAIREATFHRALARQIPDGAVTEDVYNPDQYMALRARVVEATDGDAAAS